MSSKTMMTDRLMKKLKTHKDFSPIIAGGPVLNDKPFKNIFYEILFIIPEWRTRGSN